MFPFIIQQGDFYVPTFFFMVMVASLVTTFYIYWQAKRKGLSQIAVLDISLIGTVAGILGARLFHILAEAPGYYWADPVRVFYFWQGGFVGYGVFIGIMVAAISYARWRKFNVLQYADLIALGCPIIIFLVRVGCVGAGCCYGKPTDFFLHLTFSNPASDAARDFPNVDLHATQIYDMINAIITFVIIHLVDRRKQFQGQIMLTFLMVYAFFRFWIEFLRGDVDRGVYFDGLISTSQVTGVVFIFLALILWHFWKKKYPVKV